MFIFSTIRMITTLQTSARILCSCDEPAYNVCTEKKLCGAPPYRDNLIGSHAVGWTEISWLKTGHKLCSLPALYFGCRLTDRAAKYSQPLHQAGHPRLVSLTILVSCCEILKSKHLPRFCYLAHGKIIILFDNIVCYD